MTQYAPTVGISYPGQMGIGAHINPAIRQAVEDIPGILEPEEDEEQRDYTGATLGQGLLPIDHSGADVGGGGPGSPTGGSMGNLSINAGRLGDFALDFAISPTLATANLVDTVVGSPVKGAFGLAPENAPTLADLNAASFGDVPSGNRGGTSFGGPGGLGGHDVSLDANAGSMGGVGVAVGGGGASGGYTGPAVDGPEATTSVFGDNPFGDTTASVPDGWGDPGGDSSPGGKVICTELHRQGLMPDHIFEADQIFGSLQDDDVMQGYHVWALPVVALMRKSPVITRTVALVAMPWARHMAYVMGEYGKDDRLGRLLMKTGLPLCRFIGKILTKKRYYSTV